MDSVYQHVLAWREAMAAVGIELAVWSIHRRIGKSGGLMVRLLTENEVARVLRCSPEKIRKLRRDGLLAFVPSRPVMIDEADLAAYVESVKARARPAACDPEPPAPQATALADAAASARKTWLRRRLASPNG